MHNHYLASGSIVTLFGWLSASSGSPSGVTLFFLGIIIFVVGLFVPDNKKKND